MTHDIKQRSTHTLTAESQLELARFLLAASEPSAKIRLMGVTLADAPAGDNGRDRGQHFAIYIKTSTRLSDIRLLIQRITDSHLMRQSLTSTNQYAGQHD